MAKFEGRRRYPGSHASRKFTPAGDAAVKGLALGAHASDAEAAALADGDSFIGFLTRPVTVDGAHAGNIYQDIAFEESRIEYPFKSGGEVSLEKYDEIEVESPDNLVDSGTGAVTGSTSIGTALSFSAGKVYAAQGSDQVFYRVTAILTAEEAGKVRILAEKV